MNESDDQGLPASAVVWKDDQPFVRLQRVDKVLLAWTDGTIAVYLFVLMREDREVPVELRVSTEALLDFTTLAGSAQWDEMLNAWQAPSDPQPLAVRAIRTIPVREMMMQSRDIQDGLREQQEALGFALTFSFLPSEGPAYGFKSTAELAAVLGYLRAAMAFAAAVREGSPQPVRNVADSLYDGDISKARNAVNGARRRGLLTPGQRSGGHAQGALTKEARRLILIFSQSSAQEASQGGERV